MSSATETVKTKADDLGPEEEQQTTKKIKIDESSDNNNQTIASSQVNNNNNNGNKTEQAVPSKTLNGSKANDKTANESQANSDAQGDNLNGGSGDNEEEDVNAEDIEGDNGEEDDIDDEHQSQDDGGTNTGFDPAISKALEQVENIQMEICGLNEKASEEILKVEQKFNRLRRPHFEKRDELLKNIPNFWLTALANHPIIAPMIESAEDEDCLNYLNSLDVEEFEDIKSGYRLKLEFNDNPYFTNKTIVKEFQILNSDEVISTATPIDFKDTNQGKKLRQVVEESIAQYKRSRPRPGQTQQSFFAWLVDCSEAGTDELSDVIKDQIWPNPLQYFFVAPEDYDVETDEEDESDEDEDIDDDELDDSVYPCEEYLEGEEPEDDDEDDGEEDEDEEDDDDEEAE